MKEQIRRRALELGFDDCRFTRADAPAARKEFRDWVVQKKYGEMSWMERSAEKRTEPQAVLPEARSIVCVAASYFREASEPKARSGIVARYARFDDYHDVLGERLKLLTQWVAEIGGPETRSLWYVDTGPVLERDFAQRAGIGFIGKHTNVISRRFGNWIFLAEILTTLELEPDAPETNHCGKCSRCIAACPTAAITAPFQLDARRCISYLTIELKGPIPEEFRRAIGNRIYGCDDCLAVCPWNRFAREGHSMKSHERKELEQPDLIELLSLDAAGFKKRFAGSPILRTKRRGLLRNVCVALGNVGDTSALPSLEKASHDPEPLVAEHARWAIERINERWQRHLLTGNQNP
jgi:epoxyqueuosine reductase